MITFTYPIILVLIPIIISIWYIFFREKFWIQHPNDLIAKHLKTPKKIWTLWILRSILITVILMVIAGGSITRIVTTKKILSQDIMVVFDISLSMLAEDIQPNRIETAKTVIKNFITSRTQDRIGLIIFAGKPFVSIPFSNDYSGIKSMIGWLSPYLIRQDLPGLSGTNIWDALLLANMTHSGWKSPEKAIILLTDGRANIGIDPIVAAGESLESNIKVYTIGIGSVNSGDLFYTDTNGKKVYFYSENGNKLQAELDEPMMQNIAKTTHGEYFHATNKIGLEKIFAEIEKKLPNLTEEKTEKTTMNIIPILLIIVLLTIASERVYLLYLIRKYRLN